jgi:hypothetical protein
MAASSPSQTVSPGQTATYSVAVTPIGGFNQMVTLSCSGAPAQSTCTVSPTSTRLNGSSATQVTVSVTTLGISAGVLEPTSGPFSGAAYGSWLAWLGTLGLLGPVGWRSRSADRRLRRVYGLAAVCLLFVGMTIWGCGSGSSSGGSGGAQAGTYNLTVTGSFSSGSSNLVHSSKLTLIVE